MLTSSSANQYLRPEYLSPLPTTMDAKKSPLALLAQTCSNIGVDSTNNKLLSMEKVKDHSHSERKKSGSNSSSASTSSNSSSVAPDDNSSICGSNSSVNVSNNNSNNTSNNNSNNNSSNTNNNNNTSSGSVKFSFKPYETQVTSKKVVSNSERECKSGESSGNNSGGNACLDVLTSDSNSKRRTTPNTSQTLKSSSSHSSSSSSPKCNGGSIGSPNHHSSGLSISSPRSGKNSPSERNNNNNTPIKENTHKNSSNSSSAANNTSSSSSSSASTALSYTSLGLPDAMLNGHHKDALSSLSSLAAYKSSAMAAANCCPSGNGLAHHPLSHHLNVDKTGAYPSIYPSLNYARMKSVQSGQSLGMHPSMCRDPYCAGSCQLSAMQNAALMAAAAAASAGSTCSPLTCPNGCNQCGHQRLMASLAFAHPGLVPGLSPQGYPSSFYSPALNSSLAQAARPSGNVCNWIVGDSQCGKRFATSEELLQHLRTHTSSAASVDHHSSLSSLPSLMSTPLGTSLGMSAACHGSLPSHIYSTAGMSSAAPSSLTYTAAGLRRTYPTSLSPLSNRYHPYKTGSASLTPSLGQMPPSLPPNPNMPPSMASLHNSPLSMYYASPYGIYGGRLGPQVHP